MVVIQLDEPMMPNSTPGGGRVQHAAPLRRTVQRVQRIVGLIGFRICSSKSGVVVTIVGLGSWTSGLWGRRSW